MRMRCVERDDAAIVKCLDFVGDFYQVPQLPWTSSALNWLWTMVASEKIAEIKAYGYDKVAEEPPFFALSGTKDDIDWVITIEDVLDSDFQDLVALPVQNLKKIVITVTYKVKNNQTRQDTFRSFIADF